MHEVRCTRKAAGAATGHHCIVLPVLRVQAMQWHNTGFSGCLKCDTMQCTRTTLPNQHPVQSAQTPGFIACSSICCCCCCCCSACITAQCGSCKHWMRLFTGHRTKSSAACLAVQGSAGLTKLVNLRHVDQKRLALVQSLLQTQSPQLL